MVDVSVIIVNYNTKDLLKQTIDSVIYDTRNIEYEIIVVDNASSDRSNEMVSALYPDIKLISNDSNLGFSKANNLGIKIASGRYILLLNSDTVLKENAIGKCISYADANNQVGALGCKVVLPDGSLDKACKRSFPTPKNSLYHALKLDKLFPEHRQFGAYNLTYLSEDEQNEIECLVGAFMLVRREAIDKVGLLDEDFFMYGEDIDWCYRIKSNGYKIIYYPKVQIIHYKGASSKRKRWKTIYEFHRAMYLFYSKHYINKYSFITTVMVYLGIAIKLAIAIIKNLIMKKRGVEND